jgi:hypothetical protein
LAFRSLTLGWSSPRRPLATWTAVATGPLATRRTSAGSTAAGYHLPRHRLLLRSQHGERVAQVRARLLALTRESGAHALELAHARGAVGGVHPGTAPRSDGIHARAHRAPPVGRPPRNRCQADDLGVGQTQVAGARQEKLGAAAGRSTGSDVALRANRDGKHERRGQR